MALKPCCFFLFEVSQIIFWFSPYILLDITHSRVRFKLYTASLVTNNNLYREPSKDLWEEFGPDIRNVKFFFLSGRPSNQGRRRWETRYFFYGALHKIQRYQGHQNVSKCRPHHNGDICTIRGNNLKTSFSFMGQNVKKMYILGALRGSSMIRLGLSCFPAILSPISM